jgi:hypothetical protein
MNTRRGNIPEKGWQGIADPGDRTVVVQQAPQAKEDRIMNEIRGLKKPVLIAALVLFSTTRMANEEIV